MFYNTFSKLIALACLLVSQATTAIDYPSLIRLYGLEKTPEFEQFSVCSGHGCLYIDNVSLDESKQQIIQAFFQPKADSPEAEREQIAKAIAQIEQWIGPLTETEGDARGNNFSNSGHSMDCVDESTNTSTYLTLLQDQELLHWHEVASVAHRGFLSLQMPHNTAVMKEKQSEKHWAVDSWFHDNGMPPEILHLETWRDRWYPADW